MNNDSSAADDKSPTIVKLKIDGASSAVNTIRDKHTGRGMSLVCPFPALECDIPVTFKGKEGEPSVRGAIHRIGVEDDPVSGLPRLRLSIRTQEQRDTVLTSPPKELLENAKAPPEAEPAPVPAPELKTETAAARAPWTSDRDSWSSLELDFSEERRGQYDRGRQKKQKSDFPGASYLAEQDGEDPAWVSCGEFPCAEEIMSRTRSRRRKKLAGAAIWAGIVLSAGAGIYSLDRAGVIDTTDVKSIIAGITVAPAEETQALVESGALHPAENQAVAEPEPPSEEDRAARTPEPRVQPTAATRLEEEPGAGYAATHEGMHKEVAPEGEAEPSAQAPQDLETLETLETNEEKKIEDAPADSAQPENSQGGLDPSDVTLILPTRWPAEYATAYRVRDPNGVVVDVPGGLVKREGWIEYLSSHPMIRSVKALQRETGARFIVYVHGGLPRFITTPDGKGVALRLYHESKDDSQATDEVAMLR